MKSTEVIQNLKPGDHLCFFYETDDDHSTILGRFLLLGLENKAKVIYIGDHDTSRNITALFGKKASLAERSLKKGLLVSVSWDDLKQKGELTPERLIDFIRSEIAPVPDFAPNVRIATEVTPLLPELDPERLIDFESKLDAFFKESRAIALCQYNIRMMDSAFVLDLLLTHPVVMDGLEAEDNFYYSQPLQYEKGKFPQIASRHLLKILQERKDFENQMAKGEELFRRYIDIAGVMLLVINKDEQVGLINRKGCEILGYPPEEIVGKNWFDTFLPESVREKTRAYFQELMAGRPAPEHGENPVITKSGKERTIFWHNMAVRDDTGAIAGTFSSGEDITERRQNELAVRQSEERYRSLFENALEGIFQITPEGHFLSVNPAYARLLGFESPEAMIAKVTDFGQQHYVRPEEREKFLRQMEKEGHVRGFEAQLYTLRDEKIWVSINARAVKNGSARAAYYEGMVQDITSRKQSEEALKRTLENLRLAMEGTIHAIAMTVEAKDPYTAGHQRHVGVLARAIARDLGLPQDVVEGIYMAGVIHDLGKISIPTEFLSKPGKLTDYEYILIKTHPESGYKILKGIEFPWPVAEIVLQHHERINGSGYPRRLRDKDILLEAKIIAVADTVEAITFNRPYRPAYGLSLALQEIERSEGTLFDPAAARACLDLLRTGEFSWDEQLSERQI